ncbi:MAG: hypothetical protein V3S08_00270 [Phycisphaerales bacterium]
MRYTLTITAVVVAGWSAPLLAQTDFNTHWRDGKAELDGYRWSVTRYGQERDGQAVMIFVTEPFSDARRVKADDPSKNPADTFEVLKLNLARDFQTGIYDYNTMTSVFARSDDFQPVKVSFTSGEWCGHVYEELIVDPDTIDQRLFSYFEGESATRDIPGKRDGIVGDNLFIVLSGLRGPYLRAGEKRTVPFLPGAFARRLQHRSLAWTTAEIERLAETQAVEVPAGTFTADVYVVRTNGREGRFFVEAEAPHRIIRWQWRSSGTDRRAQEAAETGELTGTLRVEYWQRHANGDERLLDDLGLAPLAP